MSRVEREKDSFINGAAAESGWRRSHSNGRVKRGPEAPASSESFINKGEDDQMRVRGYRPSRLRWLVTWVLTVLTLALLRLICYWRPHWLVWLTCAECGLDRATVVILHDQYGQCFVEKVQQPVVPGLRRAIDSSVTFRPRSSINHDEANPPDQSGVLLDSLPSVSGVRGQQQGGARYFFSKKVKYCWSSASLSFEKLRGPEFNRACTYFHHTSGLTREQQAESRELYGENNIRVHVTPVLILLYTQALNPFYIFQVFSCSLWVMDQYYYFAGCIILISIVSLAVQIREMRQTQRALKNTIASSDISSVYHPETKEYEAVGSDSLVPGDVIEIPRHGCVLQCDAVLVTGNCIVNESMLTGESVPVMKTPIPRSHDLVFSATEHSRHTLYCGTRVIQTRYYGNQAVRAVVIRTGFMTAKGELVRSILFPKPVDFKFKQDSFKFIGCLAAMAFIGMLYTLILMISRGDGWQRIFVRTLDLVTIIIPPSLPAAMTVGIVFAQKRLRSAAQVYCISPRSINLCGAIDVFCFDKTGTLTEDGLDMWGVVPVAPPGASGAGELRFGREEKDVTRLPQTDPILIAMATCHSLTRIEGELTGDPMDLKMFQATGWALDEPGEEQSRFDVFMPTTVKPRPGPAGSQPSPATPAAGRDADLADIKAGGLDDEAFDVPEPDEYGILRQFTFSSKLQRMSVIVRHINSAQFELYAKGSPEMITSLSKPDTVPADMQEVLMTYTQQGFRVIALAHRRLKLNYLRVTRAQREQVECRLTFLGLVVLENQLKPQSAPCIRKLKDAHIRTIMVTGDNMLTALSVARDCHMIASSDQVILVTATAPRLLLSQSQAAELGPSDQSEKPEIQYTYACDTRAEEFDLQTPPPTASVGGTVSLTLDMKGSTHFAVMGKSWAAIRKHHPEVIPKLCVRGTVFARFSPDEKQQLVESLQELGYYVGMCGDGANDCGALKTAHTGISLSEAEASVAAPFTCKQANICCVLSVIKEGRAALVTSFGIFKYMAGYSLTQFMSVCLLYWVRANLTDFTFLYIDLVLQTSLSITFCYTRAYDDIVPAKPKVSLIALTPIISLLSQLFINICFQLFTWKYTTEQPWFEPYVLPPEHIRDFTCHEVTAVFSVSAFQYITMAITFSKGVPYRRPMTTNWLFLLSILISTSVTVYLVLGPFQWLASLMQLKVSPSLAFRAFLLGLAGVNFFVSLLVEMFLIDTVVDQKVDAAVQRRRLAAAQRGSRGGSSSLGGARYRAIELGLAKSLDWPPPPAAGALSLAEIMKLEVGAVSSNRNDDTQDGGEDRDSDDDSQTEGEDEVMTPVSRSRRRRIDSHRSGRSRRSVAEDDDTNQLVT